MRRLVPIAAVVIAIAVSLALELMAAGQRATQVPATLAEYRADSLTAAGGGQAQPARQLAAPSAENQAEQEHPAGAGSVLARAQAAPALLPATGGPASVAPVIWLAVAVAGLAAAILGAFRIIVHEITIES